MPNVPIIDAHAHLYDTAAVRYPWMAGVPKLDGPHGAADYGRAAGAVEVEGFVWIEAEAAAGQHLDEARWIERHGGPLLRGVVASMPLEAGPAAVEADLDAFARLPHARGVRRLLQGHEGEPGWALRAPFVEALSLLPRHGLSFDLCLRHGQLGDAIALVRRCPEVRFALDHIGKPDIRAGLREPWRAELREIAAEPNVVCKLSGVVTEADHAGWTYDGIAPYVEHAVACFGFGRLMFGSDWPVCELATDYPGWVATLDRIVGGASSAELHQLYRGTAIAFYRL